MKTAILVDGGFYKQRAKIESLCGVKISNTLSFWTRDLTIAFSGQRTQLAENTLRRNCGQSTRSIRKNNKKQKLLRKAVSLLLLPNSGR